MPKSRLPKRIAGVKVPKALRKPGGKLVGLLKNPVVMDFAAAALIAAADALRAGETPDKMGRKAARPRRTAPAAGPTTGTETGPAAKTPGRRAKRPPAA